MKTHRNDAFQAGTITASWTPTARMYLALCMLFLCIKASHVQIFTLENCQAVEPRHFEMNVPAEVYSH